VLGIAAAAAVALFAWSAQSSAGEFVDSPAGGRAAVARIAARIPKSSVVFVDAAPEVAFYFEEEGFTTYCMNNSAFIEEQPNPLAVHSANPIFIVGGFFARRQGDWRPALRESADRLSPRVRFSFEPGEVRLLDDFPPSEAAEVLRHPQGQYDLSLYRYFPGPRPAEHLAAGR